MIGFLIKEILIKRIKQILIKISEKSFEIFLEEWKVYHNF